MGNVLMPVYVPPLNRWYCSGWSTSERTPIDRLPVEDKPVRLACGERFVDAFGVSIEPHRIECPKGCLQIFSPSSIETENQEVVGCGVYSADSPVCLAAIHAGALDDRGGRTIVYGRLGLPRFDKCSRNSLVSSGRLVLQSGSSVNVMKEPEAGGSSPFELPGSTAGGGRRLLTTPIVVGPDGRRVPQAFHFNNLPDVKEYVWLKSYEKISSMASGVEGGKPWTRIEATVSMRLAGLELDDEVVRLGSPSHVPLFAIPRKGQRYEDPPPSCSLSNTGVLCRGAGAAAIQLDFCRKDEKTCEVEPDDEDE